MQDFPVELVARVPRSFVYGFDAKTDTILRYDMIRLSYTAFRQPAFRFEHDFDTRVGRPTPIRCLDILGMNPETTSGCDFECTFFPSRMAGSYVHWRGEEQGFKNPKPGSSVKALIDTPYEFGPLHPSIPK